MSEDDPVTGTAFHRGWSPDPLPPALSIEAARWIPTLEDFGIQFYLDGDEEEQLQLIALARLERIPLIVTGRYSYDSESHAASFAGELRVEIDFAPDSAYSCLQGAVCVAGDWDNGGVPDHNFSTGKLFERFVQRADVDAEEDHERETRAPLKEGDVSLPFTLNPSYF